MVIMEIPKLGDFLSRLEKEKLFRDYINTFLNLPTLDRVGLVTRLLRPLHQRKHVCLHHIIQVFAKRFVYSSERKCFAVEPPVNSPYDISDDSKVSTWIHSNRLPLFWNSDLYFEYCLCCEMVNNNEVAQDVLCSVSAVHQFRRYLFRTEGESACLFWIDVERLKHTRQPWITAKLMSRIHQSYLVDNAPFPLNDALQKSILFSFDPEAMFKKVDVLVRVQSIVLDNLKSYWCGRYMVHLKEEPTGNPPGRTISSISQIDSSLKKFHSSPIQLPRIITADGNTHAEKPAENLGHVKLNTCRLPSISSSQSTLSHSDKVLEEQWKDTLQFEITPSTQDLFPQSMTAVLQSSSVEEFIQHQFHLHPYLCASLRSDFIASNPFLRYLISNQLNVALNCLLFWQSVEVLLTQDEMKRWYKSETMRDVCPYLTYFEIYPTASDPKELLRLFIKEKAPYRVDMPPDIRRELVLLLPKGLGQSLLGSVQDYATECLLKPWKDFLTQDHQQFIKSCTTQRLLSRLSSPYRRQHSEIAMASLTPPNIVKLTYGSSKLQCMWDALRYAEATKYPGIHKLPSRRVRDVTLLPDDDSNDNEDYGDLDAIDIAGMSLNPMVTTVYTIIAREAKKSRHMVLCTTKPVHSIDQQKKPPLPKSFLEMLRDPEHLEYFHHFLVLQGGNAEMQLLFWRGVEDMKASLDHKRACNSKMKRILRKFFSSGSADRMLKCNDPVIYELSKRERASPFQLLAAQSAVADSMERNWYQSYLNYLSKDESKEEETTEEQQAKKPVCREHTRGLWNMFALNVISFRRGLMNPAIANLFRDFLRSEVIKGSTVSPKKVIGTKVVNVTKLLNDLSFWAEVERYKNLADIVNAAKASGTHTPEDDIMVHKKAHAIVNCYIDSAVSPRVQINVQNELVQYILDNISQGLITRGLFHEAALNIFSVLILFWKRFCMVRFAPKRKRSSTETVTSQTHIPPSRQHSLTSVFNSGHINRRNAFPSLSIFEKRDSQCFDGGPILSFSLSAGLQWIRPTHGLFHHMDTM